MTCRHAVLSTAGPLRHQHNDKSAGHPPGGKEKILMTTAKIKRMTRKLLIFAVLFAVFTGIIFGLAYYITGDISQVPVGKAFFGAILPAVILYSTYAQDDDESDYGTEFIRDVKVHFAKQCPGKTTSDAFSLRWEPLWYLSMKTAEGKEYQATEVQDEDHTIIIIHDPEGRVIGNYVYPVPYRDLSSDEKTRLLKDKTSEICGEQFSGTDCPLDGFKQQSRNVSFTTTDGGRYLATEMGADGLELRFIHDLQTGEVIDSWVAKED